MLISDGVGLAFRRELTMYQVGDWVVYGVQGVCHIIGTEKQLVNRKRSQFLVLAPLFNQESRFYLPMDNPTALAKLKAVLPKDELISLLSSESAQEDLWIPEESRRKQYYREVIGGGDRITVMRMLSSLYRYKALQLSSGRKFHQSDDNFLRDAEKLLSSEVALVLELSQEEARNYIRTQLNQA